jgi:predicted restriction endonuclease
MMQDVQVKLNPGLPWQKQHSTRRRFFLPAKVNLNLRKKLVKSYIWRLALCGAETLAVRSVDQKHLESFEMWCWRTMEKIS